ncbi:MAG: hypothetical protein WBN40_02135 [Pseudomonadales bacterium]
MPGAIPANKPFAIVRAITRVLVCAIALAGCGYQLQKPLLLQQGWQPLFLDADINLQRVLRNELAKSNIAITRSRKQAGSVLTLRASDIAVRGISISFDGRDAELLRSIDAELAWRDASGQALAQAQLHSEQTQLASPERRAAQQREAARLDELLREKLVQQAIALLQHTAAQASR